MTSYYLVVDANLTAFQLVALGTAQGVVSFVAEVPAGVVADTVSRKWSLVAFHALLGASMIGTSMVESFGALVATQIAWGVAGTFRSGADIAWVTDELDDPRRIGGVLVASARWEQVGAVVGMLIFGMLAAATTRSTAMASAGTAMLMLGGLVITEFSETKFTPASTKRWTSAISTLRAGIGQARRSRTVLRIFITTMLVNGVGEIFERGSPRRLVEVGLDETAAAVRWFSILGASVYGVAAASLFVLESRSNHAKVSAAPYVAACCSGATGLALLAHAPTLEIAAIGILITGGIGLSVTRALSVIWVNHRATSDVRATVHSFLAQAEYFGEVVVGFALATLARTFTITVAMTVAAAILAMTGLLARTPGRACRAR